MAYRLPGRDVAVWKNGEPFPRELACVADGATEIHAHNAAFEKAIWQHVMEARHNWPPIRERQWHCTAARAAAMALPRSLDGAGQALGLAILKNAEGRRAMLKLCKPRRATENNAAEWHDGADDFATLYAYNAQDVEAEQAVAAETADLHPRERVAWLLDQRINERGIPVDRATVEAAIAVEKQLTARLIRELRDLTGGVVTSAKQVRQLVFWLTDNGCNIADAQKATIAEALEQDGLRADVRRVLEIRQQLGRAATAKFKAMLNRADADDRVRGAHLYCGAERTGRWAGRGIQIQNFPRDCYKAAEIPLAVEAIRSSDCDVVAMMFDDVGGALSRLLRPAIAAPAGTRFLVCDFAGIEARVLAWLAGERELLETFASGGDVYKVAAGKIYGKRPADVTKDQRQLGKVAVLGLGYGMGAGKFIATAAAYGITLDADFAADVVRIWRGANRRIVNFWYALNDAAIEAVETGEPRRVGRAGFHVDGRFLFLTLPCGRRLAYCDPHVALEQTPVGEKPQLSYMGINSYTKKWERLRTYGGKLAENVTQAVSRDFLVDAMIRLELAGYPVTFHVHDEIVCELPIGQGSIAEMERVMTELPKWGSGCPLAAEGFESERYRK